MTEKCQFCNEKAVVNRTYDTGNGQTANYLLCDSHKAEYSKFVREEVYMQK